LSIGGDTFYPILIFDKTAKGAGEYPLLHVPHEGRTAH
jgi:hypothetical protein